MMDNREEFIRTFTLADWIKEELVKYPDFIPCLGDTVYFKLNACFVCEARINEVNFVFAGENLPTVWVFLFEDTEFEYNTTLEELKRYKDEGYHIANIEVDVDLPVGHSFDIQFSPKYRYEDAYKYLSHAIKTLDVFKNAKKRHKAEALHGFISHRKKWLAKTNKKSVNQMNFPHYRRIDERKVYCRRK